jgi:hypothetical protein
MLFLFLGYPFTDESSTDDSDAPFVGFLARKDAQKALQDYGIPQNANVNLKLEHVGNCKPIASFESVVGGKRGQDSCPHPIHYFKESHYR